MNGKVVYGYIATILLFDVLTSRQQSHTDYGLV